MPESDKPGKAGSLSCTDPPGIPKSVRSAPPGLPSPALPGYNPAMSHLSAEAVATLRFLIRGYRMPATDRRRPAYRELAGVGILEEDGDAYRFTPWGLEHRDAILERESDRIEAGRMPPPDRDISPAARERLRLHLAGDRAVTAENHPAYRELEAARIVHHTRPFVGGDSYRLTYWGFKLKEELLDAGPTSLASPTLATAGSPSPGG